MAIGIKVRPMTENDGPGISKFFGDPVLPGDRAEPFGSETILFCQIRLEDIAELDTGGKLPHSGYLYVFLDTENEAFLPELVYHDGEPDTVFDRFNDIGGEYTELTRGWAMEFFPAGEEEEGLRLLGYPSDWPYAESPPELFMQYDPLASDMDFISYINGYMYLFFSPDRSGLLLHIEQS